ncbi:MAG: diaminopropionate ammonia-lyase [candidate division Zixibacteria bacterium]|nr:diaminopropionate ammonia-lyase [candidate division Zixibacteria bacterium]
MCQFFINPYCKKKASWGNHLSQSFNNSDIIQLHRSLPEYKPTPLVSLPGLAKSIGIKQIYVKDESFRFGLKAFKGLGSTYAIYRMMKDYLGKLNGPEVEPDKFYQPNFLRKDEFTFCTATDGNHGRAVAWAAKKLNQKAVIYMPSNTVKARLENVKSEGARVIVVDGSYDKAVKEAAKDAKKNKWFIISDTSWVGYEDIPRHIMAGYLTLFREIHIELGNTTDIDAILIQAGVGALAASTSWYYNMEYKKHIPKLISVEPTEAACMLQSIKSKSGLPLSLKNNPKSIMAGLNCGTPSLVAWPFIKTGFDLFLTVSDEYCVDAMQRYYYPTENDPQIISGESGASSLAGLLALYTHKSARTVRNKLGLNENSSILLINTEGDTDPAAFKTLIQK